MAEMSQCVEGGKLTAPMFPASCYRIAPISRVGAARPVGPSMMCVRAHPSRCIRTCSAAMPTKSPPRPSLSQRGAFLRPHPLGLVAQSPGRITPVTIIIGPDLSSPTELCVTLPSILSPTSRIASILPASAAFNSALATLLRALWSSPAAASSIRSASRNGLSRCCPLGLDFHDVRARPPFAVHPHMLCGYAHEIAPTAFPKFSVGHFSGPILSVSSLNHQAVSRRSRS